VSQPAPTPDPTADNRPAEAGPVAIAGSGTIACGLAVCAAASGLRVTLLARSGDSAARAQEAVARLSEKAGDGAAAAGVTVSEDSSELAAARLVVEAVVEREDVKRGVLEQIGRALPEDALIASTTSSLSIAELAGACGRPQGFFGLHVFNPVERMPLVELCFPDQATDDTRRRAESFCRAIGKTPVEVPDEPGFVVNRLLFPYLFDAVRLLERTGLEPEAVDACMKLGASHPMGPLELLDLIGIDVAEAIGEALHDDTGDVAHLPPGRIKGMVREGRLGRKSGAGFYRY
jgi:3-hydroxybutyryl-CoA dehydrogenase